MILPGIIASAWTPGDRVADAVRKLSVSVARKLTLSLVGGWSRDAHLLVCETTRPYLTLPYAYLRH